MKYMYALLPRGVQPLFSDESVKQVRSETIECHKK